LLINFCEWVKYPTMTLSQRTNGHQTHQTSTHSTTMCGVWNASNISQTSVKAKNHPRAKYALQQIWDDLPQTTINKAINDFRKCLNACVSAYGGHFEHMM